MIKMAIIGCGRIADAHIGQIQRIPHCEVVGVCDKEELMAKQMHERFDVSQYFSDVQELLESTKPDVVHITTPPQSHFKLGEICLNNGCHVYMEKPFTLNAMEAEELINLAVEKNLKITVGHDAQFSHVTRRMRDLINNGYLGGKPVHMESYYCYNLETERYAKAILGDKSHWVRDLPGKLLHNIISHGIARIVEYLSTDTPHIKTYGFTSPLLKKMGEIDIIDELRMIISENENITAYFTFSSQMHPELHHFRVYGQENGLILDEDQQTLIKVRGKKYKSYLEKFIPPLVFSKQYVEGSLRNMYYFLKKDFHMKSGMKFLIETFYNSIITDSPPPIPYREIVLNAKIMDSIFSHIYQY